MFENVVYISQLRPDFDVIDLENELQLDANPDEVIVDYAIHNNNAVFLAFVDSRFVEKVIHQWRGKMFLGSVVRASRLSVELMKVLNHLKPNFGQKVAHLAVAQGAEAPHSGAFSWQPAKSQNKPLTGLSDILEAFDSLTMEQELQLKATLQLKPVSSPLVAATQPKSSSPYHATSGLKQGVHADQQLAYSPKTWAPVQPQETSFQFGSSNVNSIRVSTFSGGSKDCSFEQFRYDVQSLIKQGCSEALILTAIRRSIKDQAQEILLHMGEEATVADILARYEMMFGDVDPPHVLLAQFYAAEQNVNESMTAWYARLEDLASRIIRKDASIITPNNYDVIVNTQFWTKMSNEQMKNALRHKFDVMATQSQFVVEARKIESEFAARSAKIQQATAEPVSWLKQSLDSIKDRLSALESKSSSQSTPSSETRNTPRPKNSRFRGNRQGKPSNIRCWGCNQIGHVKRDCPLNSNQSEGRSGPTR